MLFGCCCGVDRLAAAKAAGFDFVECTVVSLEPEADDARFAEILAQYQAVEIPVRACNVFLPGALKIVGDAVDWSRVQRYVERALPRAKAVGAEVVVFGSGGARSIPEGFPRTEAEDQIVRFLGIVANVAEEVGITIAIEPLNKRESNVINSVAEGVQFAQKVNRPSIRVLADFYHMDEDDEPLTNLTDHQDWLAHIHVADTGRKAPGTGAYPYAEFVSLLKQAGYGRDESHLVSVECRWDDFEAEAANAVQFLRQVWA